jgi:predicted HTH transcriptional regulator
MRPGPGLARFSGSRRLRRCRNQVRNYCNAVSKKVEQSVAKALSAFMNSVAGTLVIGVDDKREPQGLDKDIQTLKKKDKDGFELAFTNLVNAYLGKENRVLCHLKFDQQGEKTVAIVRVDTRQHPVYVSVEGDLEFYVRMRNSSQPLNIKEALQYIQEHECKKSERSYVANIQLNHV